MCAKLLTLFQGLQHFYRENVARFAELRHVGKNRGAFGKKHCNTLPAQIQKQTIKVCHVSYQKATHKCLISVVFFLTYTVYHLWNLDIHIEASTCAFSQESVSALYMTQHSIYQIARVEVSASYIIRMYIQPVAAGHQTMNTQKLFPLA